MILFLSRYFFSFIDTRMNSLLQAQHIVFDNQSFRGNLHIHAALQFSCLWTGKLQILIRSSSRRQFRVVSRRRLSCHKPSRSSNTNCGIAAWFLELTPVAIYLYLKEIIRHFFFLLRMHKNFHRNKHEPSKVSKFSEFSIRQTSRRLSFKILKNF